jgi:hypothetical protein
MFKNLKGKFGLVRSESPFAVVSPMGIVCDFGEIACV